MSNSLPVIVSTATPLQRIVEECDCGYVFQACDECSLHKQILEILKNREVLKQKGNNGYNAVKSKYNWSKDEKVLLEVLKDLVEGYVK